MKCFVSLLAASALVMACSSNDLVQPVLPPPAPPPTFVIFGIVEDETGQPLRDATADLIKSGWTTLSAITSDSGYFSFSGVSGPVTIRVRKSGFTSESRYMEVTADVLSRIRLARLLPDVVLTLGGTISAVVQAGSPPCDPEGWDAQAPCRRFYFTAPAAGKLEVVVSWAGTPELDVTLVAVGGGYVAASNPAGFERVLLEGPVHKGTDYELRVNSYYGTQEFQLKAGLVP